MKIRDEGIPVIGLSDLVHLWVITVKIQISAPSPISTPLPHHIPISAPENLLYKLLSLRHLWKEAPNTLSLQLFLDQQ